jgi:hypothetical protein
VNFIEVSLLLRLQVVNFSSSGTEMLVVVLDSMLVFLLVVKNRDSFPLGELNTGAQQKT